MSRSAMSRSTVSVSSASGMKGISYIEALQMAEDREKHVKSVFHKFDLDKSGTIDMDEYAAHPSYLTSPPVCCAS